MVAELVSAAHGVWRSRHNQRIEFLNSAGSFDHLVGTSTIADVADCFSEVMEAHRFAAKVRSFDSALAPLRTVRSPMGEIHDAAIAAVDHQLHRWAFVLLRIHWVLSLFCFHRVLFL